MKNSYIARQAILNGKSETIGYELLFRDSVDNKFPEMEMDIASSKLIIQNHIHGDIQSISMGKLAFINFTEGLLLKEYQPFCPRNKVVIEVLEDIKVTPLLIE